MTKVHTEQPEGMIVKNSVLETVPEDDIAILMYYIKCVRGVIDLSELESDMLQRLIDFKNYRRVKTNRADLEELYRLCLIYTPEKVIQAKAFVLLEYQNEFFGINKKNESVDIGGSVKRIIGMMIVTQSWINKNYIIPMSHRIKPWAQELFGCTESIPHCLCGFCCPWCYVGEDFELIH